MNHWSQQLGKYPKGSIQAEWETHKSTLDHSPRSKGNPHRSCHGNENCFLYAVGQSPFVLSWLKPKSPFWTTEQEVFLIMQEKYKTGHKLRTSDSRKRWCIPGAERHGLAGQKKLDTNPKWTLLRKAYIAKPYQWDPSRQSRSLLMPDESSRPWLGNREFGCSTCASQCWACDGEQTRSTCTLSPAIGKSLVYWEQTTQLHTAQDQPAVDAAGVLNCREIPWKVWCSLTHKVSEWKMPCGMTHWVVP